MVSGWSSIASGQASEGLALVEKGLAAVRETGAVFTTPYFLIMLAQGHAALKRIPVILKHSLRERNSWRIRLGLVLRLQEPHSGTGHFGHDVRTSRQLQLVPASQ